MSLGKMLFNWFKKANWRWEFSGDIPKPSAELLSFWQKPELSSKAQLIWSQKDESGFELIEDYPGLPTQLWLRIRDYQEPGFYYWLRPKKSLWSDYKKCLELYPEIDLVARPVAYGSLRKGWWIIREVMVFESLSSCRSLGDYLKDKFGGFQKESYPVEKRELIVQLAKSAQRIFLKGLMPGSEISLKEVFLSIIQDRVRLIFLRSEQLGKINYSEQDQIQFLAWWGLALKPYLPRTYWWRFFKAFFSGLNLSRAEFLELMNKILIAQEKLLEEKIKRVRKEVWQRRFPFFWFNYKRYRIFLRVSVSQNQIMELVLRLGFLVRKGERLRLKLSGEKEPMEAELVEVKNQFSKPGLGLKVLGVSRLLELEGIAHQSPLVVIEDLKPGSAEGFLIYQALGAAVQTLAEYLAGLVNEELSGKSWDRRFLYRIAHFLLKLHNRGVFYENPLGDEIYVEKIEPGREKFYLAHLERICQRKNPTEPKLKQNVFKFLSALPLSRTDAIMVLEEYLRHSPLILRAKEKELQKKILDEFQIYSQGGNLV